MIPKTKTIRIDFQVDRHLVAALLLHENRWTDTEELGGLYSGVGAIREAVRDALYLNGVGENIGCWADYCSDREMDVRQAWADGLIAAAYPELRD